MQLMVMDRPLSGWQHAEIVECLMDHIDLSAIKARLFNLAASCGHVGVMERLKSIVDVNVKVGRLTPLAEAAKEGRTKAIRYLLSLGSRMHTGIDLDSVMHNSFHLPKTPLDLALAGNHIGCATLLESHGALTWESIGTKRLEDGLYYRTWLDEAQAFDDQIPRQGDDSDSSSSKNSDY